MLSIICRGICVFIFTGFVLCREMPRKKIHHLSLFAGSSLCQVVAASWEQVSSNFRHFSTSFYLVCGFSLFFCCAIYIKIIHFAHRAACQCIVCFHSKQTDNPIILATLSWTGSLTLWVYNRWKHSLIRLLALLCKMRSVVLWQSLSIWAGFRKLEIKFNLV